MIEQRRPCRRRPIWLRASRQTIGPAPQLTPTASTPAVASAVAIVCGSVPSMATRSSPKVIGATIGRSDGARAPRDADQQLVEVAERLEQQRRRRRPRAGPRSARGSRARTASLGQPRRAVHGRAQRPDRAADERRPRPATSRASRASWAARRFSRPAWLCRPNGARRKRLAPKVIVSIASAPATMYSRWIVADQSGCVVDQLVEAMRAAARHGCTAACPSRRRRGAAGGEASGEALARRHRRAGRHLRPPRRRRGSAPASAPPPRAACPCAGRSPRAGRARSGRRRSSGSADARGRARTPRRRAASRTTR